MIAAADDLLACQFARWYPSFPRVTIKSRVLPLPPLFLKYLEEDGVFVPIASHLDHDQLSDEEGEELKSEQPEKRTEYSFPEIEEEIGIALRELGGQLFIKLNWSAPLDAAWMNAGSMKCQSAHEIFLLLKASDRVVFDIDHMFDLVPDSPVVRPTELTLVLRKWANLHPSMEFRVFVYQTALVGICQRNCTVYFPFLEGDLDGIVREITAFHDREVRPHAPLPSYALDIYIDQKRRVWIVDFNPFGAPTCPLLFEWDELAELQELDARVVCSPEEVLQSAAGSKRGPVDVHMAEDFPRFLDICKRQQQSPESESDSEH